VVVRRSRSRHQGNLDPHAEQQPRYAPPPPQYAPAPPAAPSAFDPLDELKKLGELRAAGVLTEAEFAAQKAKVLAG